jgi:nucleobase:cation symporter-1, NCS1 family
MSFFTGFGVSSVVYIILNILFPAKGASREFLEVDLSAYDEDRSDNYSDVDRDEKDKTEGVDVRTDMVGGRD